MLIAFDIIALKAGSLANLGNRHFSHTKATLSICHFCFCKTRKYIPPHGKSPVGKVSSLLPGSSMSNPTSCIDSSSIYPYRSSPFVSQRSFKQGRKTLETLSAANRFELSLQSCDLCHNSGRSPAKTHSPSDRDVKRVHWGQSAKMPLVSS